VFLANDNRLRRIKWKSIRRGGTKQVGNQTNHSKKKNLLRS
jgi:hypothetical protein